MKNKNCCFTGVCLVGISLLLAGLSFSTMATGVTSEVKSKAPVLQQNLAIPIRW